MCVSVWGAHTDTQMGGEYEYRYRYIYTDRDDRQR
jgi:hypothetical protein